MKKLSTSITRIYSMMISGLISILGFASCEDDNQNVTMYGSPYGEFEAKGTVTDEEGKPVKDAQIITRPVYISYDGVQNVDYYNSDTTYTNATGKYTISDDRTGSEYLRIIVHPKNDDLESDSTREKLHYVGGDHSWYMGKAILTKDFTLKAKADTEEEE